MHSSLLAGSCVAQLLIISFCYIRGKIWPHWSKHSIYLLVLLSAYEQEVMIGMFQDLGAPIFTFGSCGALYISVISHFVTFEAKYDQNGINIPCIYWYN